MRLINLAFDSICRNTLSLNMYNLGLKYTSPTVASATTNSIPVVTFFFALLLRRAQSIIHLWLIIFCTLIIDLLSEMIK